MKKLGLFEAKTKFSEVCDEVARTGQSVTVTRRGKPLVRIDPVNEATMTIRERREEYMARHAGHEKPERKDFEPPKRSRDAGRFTVGRFWSAHFERKRRAFARPLKTSSTNCFPWGSFNTVNC